MAEVPKASMDNEGEITPNNPVNGDGDRQVLAPSEGPREDLINTAIKFLQNPKVMGSPLIQKKAFLTKKGLTEEEISLAVERAGVTETATTVGNVVANQARPPPPGYQPGVMAPYGQMQPPIPQQSRWAQARDIALTSLVVGGVSYAVYQLYKIYIEPLIRGKSIQEKRIERLESQVQEIHKSVNESLSEISRTLAAIQLSVSQNQQPSASQSVGRGITDLKADISSLRSLLLSKNQFPAPPTTTPMLPSWQLAGSSSEGPRSISGPSTPAAPTSPKTSPSVPVDNAVSASAESADGEKEGESEGSSLESSTQSKADQASTNNGNEADNDANTNDAKTS